MSLEDLGPVCKLLDPSRADATHLWSFTVISRVYHRPNNTTSHLLLITPEQSSMPSAYHSKVTTHLEKTGTELPHHLGSIEGSHLSLTVRQNSSFTKETTVQQNHHLDSRHQRTKSHPIASQTFQKCSQTTQIAQWFLFPDLCGCLHANNHIL